MFSSRRFDIQNRYNEHHQPGGKFANEFITYFFDQP